jgi:hypothetical protein
MAEQSMDNSGTETPIGPNNPSPLKPRKEGFMGGVVLVVLGLLLLANNVFPQFDFSDYWPLILVAIGIALLVQPRHSR